MASPPSATGSARFGPRAAIRDLFSLEQIPWVFLAIGFAALVIQLHPSWRESLIYDRGALGRGEWWRIWTGQLVHFGWPHFVADTGLFLILGRLLEHRYRWPALISLVSMPPLIAATLYWLQPSTERYGGLSAVNLGLLVFLACRGWQRDWFDWFWPSVLAIYVGEVVLEATFGHGQGGGMIRFDDPSIRVATGAHIATAVFGVALWLVCSRIEKRAIASN